MLRQMAMPQRLHVVLAVVLVASCARAEKLTDAVKAPRPQGGEYMGLYLKGQKIGYMFSDVTLSADKRTVTATTELHFRAKVGQNISDRTMRETRQYDASPNGRLRSFKMEQLGDGGDQILEATATAKGLTVVRRKPGQPDEVKQLPASKEVVEDADQARVALLRNAKVSGTITDSTDLQQYGVTTTVGPTEERTIAGVKVKLRKVTTLSEKEKVPTEAWVDEKGRMVEVQYGPMMSGLLEPEDKAKRVDLVEVFGLTRVVLPKTPSPAALQVPGSFTMTVKGVPEKFWNDTYRQTWKKKADGAVEVTVSAAPPRVLKPRPLIDPNGGENLKSTIAVEADAPAVVALAKKIVGSEKDAWTAAKKISAWVHDNLGKDYGASSDSATGVLQTMKGDCTEHSLLAVSLMRAVGIPARRIDGLVYLTQDDKIPALYWHEWVEAYVGEWTQLDPTFGQAIAHPARLGVGQESSAEITPLIGSMSVLDDK